MEKKNSFLQAYLQNKANRIVNNYYTAKKLIGTKTDEYIKYHVCI